MFIYLFFFLGKVKFERPNESPENWFNILMVHQNRVMRAPKDYLPEERIPSFMDLVVWGHEHDCRVEEEKIDIGNFYITQPGKIQKFSESLYISHLCNLQIDSLNIKSHYFLLPFCYSGSSVVTSLSEGESIPKKVALVQVHGRKFQLKPIPLQTVRPFIFRDMDLSEYDFDDDVRDPKEAVSIT